MQSILGFDATCPNVFDATKSQNVIDCFFSNLPDYDQYYTPDINDALCIIEHYLEHLALSLPEPHSPNPLMFYQDNANFVHPSS